MKQSWIIKLMCAVTVSSCTLTLVAGRAPYCDQNWSYRRTLSACGPPEICRNCNRQRQLSPDRYILNDECIAKHGTSDELQRWCMVLPSGYTGDIEVCKTPAISNSKPYNCTNNNKHLKKYFRTGKMVPETVCIFNCDHGYILNGSKTVECVDEPKKLLQWNDSLPSCEPIADVITDPTILYESSTVTKDDVGNETISSANPAGVDTDQVPEGAPFKVIVVVVILSAVAVVILCIVIILLCKKHYSKWCRDITAFMRDCMKTEKASANNGANENFLSHTESPISVENHAAQPDLIGIPGESKTPRQSVIDGQEELPAPELLLHLQQLNLGEHTSQQVLPQPPLSQRSFLKPTHPRLTATVTPISREPVENDDRTMSACPEQSDICNHIIQEQKLESNSLFCCVDNSAYNPRTSNTLTDLDSTSRKKIWSDENNACDNENISEGKFGQLTEDGGKVTKVAKQEEQNEAEPHEIQHLLNSIADKHRSEASGASQSDIDEDDANSSCKEELSSRETVL